MTSLEVEHGHSRELEAIRDGHVSSATMMTTSTGVTDNRAHSAWIERATLDLKARQAKIEEGKVPREDIDLNSITAAIRKSNRTKRRKRLCTGLSFLLLLVGAAVGSYFGLGLNNTDEAQDSDDKEEAFRTSDIRVMGTVCVNLEEDTNFAGKANKFYNCIQQVERDSPIVLCGTNGITELFCPSGFACQCSPGLFIDARSFETEDELIADACIPSSDIPSDGVDESSRLECLERVIDQFVDMDKLLIEPPTTSPVPFPTENPTSVVSFPVSPTIGPTLGFEEITPIDPYEEY